MQSASPAAVLKVNALQGNLSIITTCHNYIQCYLQLIVKKNSVWRPERLTVSAKCTSSSTTEQFRSSFFFLSDFFCNLIAKHNFSAITYQPLSYLDFSKQSTFIWVHTNCNLVPSWYMTHQVNPVLSKSELHKHVTCRQACSASVVMTFHWLKAIFLVREPNVKSSITTMTSENVHICTHTVMGKCYVTVGSVYLFQMQRILWTFQSPHHMTIVKHADCVL